jgi:predicted amidohydrolase
LICWDLAFPEAFRALVSQGAKLIIIPSFWLHVDCNSSGLSRNPKAEGLFIDSTLVARAFENTCAVVYVNAGGPEKEDYAGLSQVTVPFVGSLGRHAGPEEGVSYVDIDMAILEEAEDAYKIRADLSGKGVGYEAFGGGWWYDPKKDSSA